MLKAFLHHTFKTILILLIVGGAIAIRSLNLDHASLTPEEKEHVHYVQASPTMADIPEHMTFFHPMSYEIIAFMNEYRTVTPVRYYRLVPLIAATLTILLFLGLGLRHRNGLFETEDALYWSIAFVALAPPAITASTTFTPTAWGGFIFVVLLITMRAYAQWPNWIAAAFFGFFSTALVAIDAHAIWGIGILLISIVIGVGWRRLCLYWRTWHVAMALLAAVLLGGLLWHFQLLDIPARPQFPSDFLHELLQRLKTYCLYGVGLIFWGWVTTWAFLRSDRRFARVLSLLFLLSFWASFFFIDGGIFAIPLMLLVPILGALTLSTISAMHLRWIFGNLILALEVTLTTLTLRAQHTPSSPPPLQQGDVENA